jgi:radical SAM-linked protein
MRIRITFAKTSAMRYTSHLDLQRTWERTLRRAGMPLAYSQGFNPRPKINIASALPLGFTGLQELVDIWLENHLPIEEINNSLTPALPPGLHIIHIGEIESRTPSLQSQLVASEYTITFLEPISDLESRLKDIFSADHITRTRRGKEYDLRPLILEISNLPLDENGCQRVFVRLSAHVGATGRADEVIKALGVMPETTHIQRTKLIFQSD